MRTNQRGGFLTADLLFRALSIGVLGFGVGALTVWGQSSTGDITVTVTDASDAAVSDARIMIAGAETGAVVRQLTSSSSGMAQASLLNPGKYDIRIEKEGFKTVNRTGIVLRVTDVLRLNIVLEVGTATQSVTIEGEAPLIQTESNAQGQVISSATLQQLPLNGRNYLQLAVMTAGTVPSANKDQSFSAFGNRGMQNVYLLDGGLNQSYIRGIDNHQRDAVRPQLEAIQEFKVQTSNYSAEYGSSAGGVVSVVAHLGHPVARADPYALHHPERADVPIRRLDLVEVGALTFEAVDEVTFPCLRLAREAAMAGGTAPCVLNAANEVAVHAFLEGRLRFLDIPSVIEQTLEELPAAPVRAFESLFETDRAAREFASGTVAARA